MVERTAAGVVAARGDIVTDRTPGRTRVPRVSGMTTQNRARTRALQTAGLAGALAIVGAGTLLLPAAAKPAPPPTPAYVLGQEIVTVSAAPRTDGTPTVLTAICPAGKVVTGGGYSAPEAVQLSQSSPGGPDRWVVVVQPYEPNAAGDLTAYAVCVNA